MDENNLENDKGQINHYKNSRRNRIKLKDIDYEETEIKWNLSKYLGASETNPLDAEYFPWSSSNKLNNGLSADELIKFLGSTVNCVGKDLDHR